MNKEIKRIAVLVESSRASGRGLIEGISAYATTREDWLLYYHEGTFDLHLSDWLERWQGDGIITRITSEEQAQLITARGIPVVDLMGGVPRSGISTVHSDNIAIAESATDFFLRAGFSDFAYCGYPGIPFSDVRQETFEKAAISIGASVISYQSGRHDSNILERESWHSSQEEDLAQWLKSLKKPAAIFACNDIRALQIAGACRLYDIRVPEDVIILGVDNDRLICGMNTPALSSIEPDHSRQGWRGAEVLQHLLESSNSVTTREAIAPKAIIERPSTDMIVFANPIVAAAVRLIRKKGSESMSAEQIASALEVSRSLLDRSFKNEIGHTVSDEIRRIRLHRISHMLRYTDATIGEIANETGFSTDANLAKFFKSVTGSNPGAYRKSTQKQD